ncbi:protein phosphatase [Insulibacter thermoxylanivorax]|uniref:Protein phosphatase n=1 Tax=Insulibacter thermoxylanivorax TaxID=2749268 RepID=A0A916QBP6_9BACL|nr:Stp1/IreP family PP2C-type Ser/Thr phosphatase [Insulibacter thermoxylanivorax]GFR37795.1 protein phosphatase [Insulibacter thermoxylanivorax]
MKTANITDVGRVRLVNEDRACVEASINGFAFAVVADGMGGHLAGDVASQMTTQYIEKQMRQRLVRGMNAEQCAALLRDLIREANREVYELANSSEQYVGMGTTVVAAIADRERVVVAHIGDSRAYMISGRSIVQLTEDHSLVNELLKSGQINEEEAASHPRRNVLVRALGTDPEVDVDVVCREWKEKDVLLLCTDGLSGLVKTETIVETMNTDAGWSEKAGQLVDKALDAGGDDNITIVLLINEQDEASPESAEQLDGRGEAG